jgi:hypothetical protein
MGVVTAQELRDLWLGGRGLVLGFAFSLLLSVIAYLVATNRALNFLEHRETVNLTLQVAIAVGALLALLAAADTISGERERGTLQTLLLTPVSRLEITIGKLVAALSLWLAAFLITIPYVWFLGRGVGLVGDALRTGALVGTLLAVFLASLGVLISVFAASNRVSLSLSLLLLLALFVPTQLPSSAQQGWARRSPVADQPDHCGRALRREDRHQRARVEPGRLLAPLAGHRRGRLRGGGALRRRPVHPPAGRRVGVRRLAAAVIVASVVWVPAARAAGHLAVASDRAAVVTKLGRKFVVHSRIENRGSAVAADLVAHLNVVDLSGHTYVDPEDWSSQRTRYLAPIPPGGSTTLTWRLNAVNAGTIGIYIAVLPRSGAPVRPTTGPTVRVSIKERRSLNSAGILPLALGIPGFLGALALGVKLKRRRGT